MNKKGLTLIEIIISVLIILIVSAGVMSAFVGGHQLMNRSRHRLQALNLAREALDKLRVNYTYSDSEMDVGDHTEAEIVEAVGDEIIRGEMDTLNSAALTYTVTETQPDGYKKTGVTVDWIETGF